MGPSVSGVDRFVHAIAVGNLGAHVGFARADVNDVGIGWSDGEIADRANGLAVEDRFPGRAGIGALPHASVYRAHVEEIGLAGNADCGQCASPAKRADQTPAEAGVKCKINRLGQGGLQRETKQKSEGAKKGSSPVSHVRSCRVLNLREYTNRKHKLQILRSTCRSRTSKTMASGCNRIKVVQNDGAETYRCGDHADSGYPDRLGRRDRAFTFRQVE